MHNTFARRHALAEIAGDFAQGATVAQLETATNRYLADPTARPLISDPDDTRYTTLGLLACERAIVDSLARREHDDIAVVDDVTLRTVLDTWQPTLNPEQVAAVRALTTSGHGVDAVTAVAGSGKTTMIGALAACYHRQGWEVIGTAPTARAARQLRESADIPADTMHALLLRLTRTGGIPPRTVLVLDEAGMAPTRLTARLLELAEHAGAKVIAVGDPGQLGSVEAGGWLAAITAQHPHPTLTTAIRQHDPAERKALRALRDGDPDPYLQHKQTEITIHERELAAIQALIDQWQHARHQHGPTGVTMIARDNYTRELANRAARRVLKTAGHLPPNDITIGGREYSPGDRVVARRNNHDHDIDNGTLATIIAIGPDTGSMIVETDAGQPRALDHAYTADHLEHAYALTAHSAQGATFQWAGVIGRPAEFTREWAYTALSRARTQTVLHVIAEPHEREREREQYAPPAPQRDPAHIPDDLRQAMQRPETETLAITHTPDTPTTTPSTDRHTSPELPPPTQTHSSFSSEPIARPAPPAALPDQPAPAPALPTPVVDREMPLVKPAAATSYPAASPLKGVRSLRRLRNQRRGPSLQP